MLFLSRLFALPAFLLTLSAVVAVMLFSRQKESMLFRKGGTLQYHGPLYVGDGEWERTFSPPIQTAMLARVSHEKGLLTKQHPEATVYRSALMASREAVKAKTVKTSHESHPLRKVTHTQTLTSAVRNLPGEISDGLTKIFHLHDNSVKMRAPVKILDHV